MNRDEYKTRCTEVKVLCSLIAMNVASSLRPGATSDRLEADVNDIARRFETLAKKAITTAVQDRRAIRLLERDLRSTRS